MNFRQRLLRYLIGIGIGCLLVFVIFPKMDWLGWTPGKQMNKRIRQATWVASDYGVCTMKCNGVDNNRFDQARFNGEVNFEMSDVHAPIPRYQLEHENLNFQILVADTMITLIEVAPKTGQLPTCNCK